jgi:DNA-directed RNA polymerase subunit RPC12/RpoP
MYFEVIRLRELFSECRDLDPRACVCKAQEKIKSPSIGCRGEEVCYVCWRCGRYFGYSLLILSERLVCPCCGYPIVAKARQATGRAVRSY